jgi:hypothetical protein
MSKFILVGLLLCNSLPLFLSAQDVEVNYQVSADNMINPGRGWYRYTELRASDPEVLSLEELSKLRIEEQITLVFRYVYLDQYYTQLIPEDFLALIEQDFRTLRTAGAKVILRFAYTSELPDKAPYLDTPKKELVFQHIQQLGPLIRANSDVILTLQNGFYGTWGENYYSDEFGSEADGPLTMAHWANRKQVTDALLSYLPTETLLSVRYPTLKTTLYNYQIPADSLTYTEAYDGSIKSRIGYHNDCFLVAPNDYTFDNTSTEKPYWEGEAKYTIMGGESCGDNSTFTNCENALKDLTNAHWTYLNDYYHPDVLQRWKTEDCYEEIVKRLGYRLVLVKGSFDTTIQKGQDLNIHLTLKNEGFAAPISHQSVVLVLRNQREEYRLDLKANPKRWFGGQTFELKESIQIPTNIEAGKYQLYLRIPDQHPNLAEDAAYAIQLANEGSWNLPADGLNDLKIELSVRENDVVSTNKNVQSYQIRIFPNPGKDLFQIEVPDALIRHDLRVFDYMGKTVHNYQVSANLTSISLAHLPPGMYWLRIGPSTRKIIKY